MEKYINDLFGNSWNNAIDNVCDKINKALGTSYFRERDMNVVEDLALSLKIRFDDNGNII